MAVITRGNHKNAGMELVHFIEEHFDMVDQEEYFNMCEMVLSLIQDLAEKEGWVHSLVKESSLFELVTK